MKLRLKMWVFEGNTQEMVLNNLSNFLNNLLSSDFRDDMTISDLNFDRSVNCDFFTVDLKLSDKDKPKVIQFFNSDVFDDIDIIGVDFKS